VDGLPVDGSRPCPTIRDVTGDTCGVYHIIYIMTMT